VTLAVDRRGENAFHSIHDFVDLAMIVGGRDAFVGGHAELENHEVAQPLSFIDQDLQLGATYANHVACLIFQGLLHFSQSGFTSYKVTL
jgi:hypothetical protein